MGPGTEKKQPLIFTDHTDSGGLNEKSKKTGTECCTANYAKLANFRRGRAGTQARKRRRHVGRVADELPLLPRKVAGGAERKTPAGLSGR